MTLALNQANIIQQMHITISKENLLKGLQSVQGVVGSRSTLPILANVLLRAEGNLLHFTATDLDMAITCNVEAKVEIEGTTTLPVKRLFNIVRELSSGDITMESNDKHICSVNSGGSRFKIHGISADEFPPSVTLNNAKEVKIDRGVLGDMLSKTCFAMSTDEARYVLNGSFMRFKDNQLTVVATDGRRMALIKAEVDVPEASTGEFIIPAKAVAEIQRTLQEKGEVRICFNDSRASFETETSSITTKLIEGQYPNFQQVIPSEARERVGFPREELLGALRRAQIMTTEKFSSVKLAFTKNNLSITANTPEVGEAKEILVVNHKGGDVAIAFNPRYVIDPLTALKDESVFVELIDDLSPAVLKTEGSFLYVVMPMRLS